MTKIKLCGLRRPCDIEYANELNPDYIGFIFAKSSKRYVTPGEAYKYKQQLNSGIAAVGVFVDEEPQIILNLLKAHTIDVVQLHGHEDEKYIKNLKEKTDCIIIKAFQIKSREDIIAANESSADYVLLDSGGGSGITFDRALIKGINRPYFLAGGLTPENVKEALDELTRECFREGAEHLVPYGVDASSCLETDGYKDKYKMTSFVRAVRERKD